MGVDPEVARAVVEAVCRTGTAVLVAQPDTVVVEQADRAGLQVVLEGFPDRGYLPDGRLVPRDQPGALVEDPVEVGRRAVSLVRAGGVDAVDGTWTPVVAQTLCIHGDTDQAVDTARAVRSALEVSGIVVMSFLGTTPAGPGAGTTGTAW